MMKLASIFMMMTLTAYAQNSMAEAIEKTLFTLEKSYNSENIMLIHTQINEECKFVEKSNRYFDFYWLMNGSHRKEVHAMIRNGVNERVKFQGINPQGDSFSINLEDLSELKHDLDNRSVEIISEMVNGVCEVKSIITLGASEKYRKLNLKRTYCEVTKNFIGIPTGCKFLELYGNDANNGEEIKVRFNRI